VVKRRRGRPTGNGKPDEAALYEIALRRARDPSLKMWAAVKQVVADCQMDKNTNTVRRIFNKYRQFEVMHGDAASLYVIAEQYEPNRHSCAPIGSWALVNQHNSAMWADMSRNGWQTVHHWKYDEWIIRRYFRRILTLEELHRECAEYLVQFGLIDDIISADNIAQENNETAPFGA
jgi:hypothetical protein